MFSVQQKESLLGLMKFGSSNLLGMIQKRRHGHSRLERRLSGKKSHELVN
jgi:hypothetical protein